MEPLDGLDWEILNATADDWETLDQIDQLLPGGLANGEGMAARVLKLVERGLLATRFEAPPPSDVAVLRDRNELRRAWFAMTPSGRVAWAASEHAAEV